jgi:aspartate racemase
VKVVGLLGGMSWESSAEYYRLVNERVKAALGGFHSARVVLYSVDFAEVEAMQAVHRVIYDELVQGVIRAESREAYRGVIRRLVEAGAEGVVYGCTEIELLVDATDSPVPSFPTTRLHAEAAADWALGVAPLPPPRS